MSEIGRGSVQIKPKGGVCLLGVFSAALGIKKPKVTAMFVIKRSHHSLAYTRHIHEDINLSNATFASFVTAAIIKKSGEPQVLCPFSRCIKTPFLSALRPFASAMLPHIEGEKGERKDQPGVIGNTIQGPAGSKVPDEDEMPQQVDFEELPDVADLPFEYLGDDEAPEEAAGPAHRLGPVDSFAVEEMMTVPEVEAAATAAAHVPHTSTEAMLDAMEEAESQFEGAEAPSRPQPPVQPSQNQRHHHAISDSVRHKVVQRLNAVFVENKAGLLKIGAQPDAVAVAEDCERELYASSKSLPVYLSVSNNAVRAAQQATTFTEVLRVARGEVRDETERHRNMRG